MFINIIYEIFLFRISRRLAEFSLKQFLKISRDLIFRKHYSKLTVAAGLITRITTADLVGTFRGIGYTSSCPNLKKIFTSFTQRRRKLAERQPGEHKSDQI